MPDLVECPKRDPSDCQDLCCMYTLRPSSPRTKDNSQVLDSRGALFVPVVPGVAMPDDVPSQSGFRGQVCSVTQIEQKKSGAKDNCARLHREGWTSAGKRS